MPNKRRSSSSARKTPRTRIGGAAVVRNREGDTSRSASIKQQKKSRRNAASPSPLRPVRAKSRSPRVEKARISARPAPKRRSR